MRRPVLDPVLAIVVGLCLAFVALGSIFIPYAGIQNDEALFTNPIYQHAFEFHARVFHHQIPLMIMSYMGTVKTLLYWPILYIFPAGPYSVRLPMLLVGSLTVLFFFFLAEKISGRWAAFIAALLLATDPTFLLTDTFDWGPVTIEHFLLVTGILAVVQYHQQGAKNHRWLATGFLCLGFALWNKAIFLWALTGLVAATVVVCHQEIRCVLTPRRAGIAAAAFIVGASPFIVYNIRSHNETLRASAKLEAPDWNGKFIQLRSALDGSSMFILLVSGETRERPPEATSGRLALTIRERLGEHTASVGDYAVLACLLAVPLWLGSRAARFSLVFCAVTWLMMVFTKGAGGSVHHVVLLWPFPQLFIGIVLAAIPWRAITGLFAAFLALSNLLVVNQYLLQMERDGPGNLFTDAIYALSDALPAYSGETVYVTDWGIQNSLALLHKGSLRMEIAEGDFNKDDVGQPEREHIAKMAADRNAIFVGHVAGEEVFRGSRERVSRAAENAGLRKQVIQIIADSHGRPAFEIFRWAPPANSPISR